MSIRAIIVLMFLTASIQFFQAIRINLPSPQRSQFELAANLLKTLQNDKSIILSPIAISTKLFMINPTANGETKPQIYAILGGRIFNGTQTGEFELNDFIQRLLKDLNRTRNSYTLNIANRFYTRQRASKNPDFDRMLQIFGGETYQNFTYGQKNQLEQEISDLVSKKTKKKITKLMTSNSINEDTKILLSNGYHFNGTWEGQFNSHDTEKGIFHISETERKNASLMTITGNFPYFEDNLVQVVRLPYLHPSRESALEMVIILPKKRFNLADVRARISGAQIFRYFSEAKSEPVTVKLPKFRIEGKVDLKNTLQKFGITDIFSNKANSEKLTKEQISSNSVMHAGSFEESEEGTESTVSYVRKSAHPKMNEMVSKSLIADHPFILAVVRNLKTFLFIGQFVK